MRQAWKTLNPRVKIVVMLFILAATISTGISPELRVSLGILKGWIVMPMLLGFLVYAAKISEANPKQRYLPLIRGIEGVSDTLLYALVTSSTVVSLLALLRGPVEGRLVGIYDTPNSLALYVSPILAATIWASVYPPAAPRKALGGVGIRGITAKTKMMLVTGLIQAAALLGSESVSGVTACIISLLISAHLFPNKWPLRRWYIATGTGALLAIIVLTASGKIGYLLEPLKNPSAHNSATVRLQLWSISLDLIKEHPLGGVGLGQFEPAYQQALHQRFQDYSLRITHYALLITILIFGLTDTIYWKNDIAALYWVVVAMLL